MEYELMFLIAEDKKPDFSRIKDEVRATVENAGGTWTGEELEFEIGIGWACSAARLEVFNPGRNTIEVTGVNFQYLGNRHCVVICASTQVD